jgi:hypothetical protein
MEQDKKPKNKPKYLQEIAVSFFFFTHAKNTQWGRTISSVNGVGKIVHLHAKE